MNYRLIFVFIVGTMIYVGLYYGVYSVKISKEKKKIGDVLIKISGILKYEIYYLRISDGTPAITYQLLVHSVGNISDETSKEYAPIGWSDIEQWYDRENNGISESVQKLKNTKIKIDGKLYQYCESEYRLINPKKPTSNCYASGDFNELRLEITDKNLKRMVEKLLK